MPHTFPMVPTAQFGTPHLPCPTFPGRVDSSFPLGSLWVPLGHTPGTGGTGPASLPSPHHLPPRVPFTTHALQLVTGRYTHIHTTALPHTPLTTHSSFPVLPHKRLVCGTTHTPFPTTTGFTWDTHTHTPTHTTTHCLCTGTPHRHCSFYTIQEERILFVFSLYKPGKTNLSRTMSDRPPSFLHNRLRPGGPLCRQCGQTRVEQTLRGDQTGSARQPAHGP